MFTWANVAFDSVPVNVPVVLVMFSVPPVAKYCAVTDPLLPETTTSASKRTHAPHVSYPVSAPVSVTVFGAMPPENTV